MKKFFLCTLLFLILLIPSINANWFYNSKEVTVSFDISSGATLVPTDSNYKIKDVGINLTFYPKQFLNQRILESTTTPKATKEPGSLYFSWISPTETDLNLNLITQTKKTQDRVKVTEKINFPILNLPEEITEYTDPSITIDSDDEDIIRLASSIVEGEEDLYIAVFKIAEWTKNNIEYDLSTLTADVSQKASWVLENKQGVCDELTSLFIAMLRSVGIPARFISGMAYTNSPLFPENWGPHGWAEVYFPSVGWVPYDVTYGEFGFVDPTHFKFQETIDPDTPSTTFNWVGKNIDLETKELDIKAKLINHQGKFDYGIKISTELQSQHIDFGSRNLLKVIIENQNDYYTSTELFLSAPREVSILGKNVVSVILKPKEKKDVLFPLKVPNTLNANSIYTMPIVIRTTNNQTSSTSFDASIDGSFISKNQIDIILQAKQRETEKILNSDIDITCDTIQPFYEYEEKNISCSIKNLGNVFLEDLNICFNNKCQKKNIGIAKQIELSYILPTTIGQLSIPLTAENDQSSKTYYLDYKVLDPPKLLISNLEYPDNVGYDQIFTVSFLLEKNSTSNPKNILVKLQQNKRTDELTITELASSEEFILEFIGSNLRNNQNTFNIQLTYEDANGKSYEKTQEFPVTLTNLTFIQRINQFFKQIFGII